jgi:hypothetical protein
MSNNKKSKKRPDRTKAAYQIGYELGLIAGYAQAKHELGIGITTKVVPLELSDHYAHGM